MLTGLHIVDRPIRLLHTTEATLIGSVYIMLPLMILTLYAQMSEIDLAMMRAARTLGARPAQVFLRIFLPLSMPGVVAGSLLTFIVSLGLFVTPALLGGPSDRTFSMLIEQQVNTFGDFSAAAALSISLLIASLVVLWLFFRVTGAGYLASSRGSRIAKRSRHLGSWGTKVLRGVSPILPILDSRHTWNLVLAVVLAFLFLPLVTLIPMSLGSGAYLQFPPKEFSLRWFSCRRSKMADSSEQFRSRGKPCCRAFAADWAGRRIGIARSSRGGGARRSHPVSRSKSHPADGVCVGGLFDRCSDRP